jgi:hypothetical protein
MLFVIGAILLVLWLVGYVSLHLLGAYIHLVLLLAIAVMLMGLLSLRPVART